MTSTLTTLPSLTVEKSTSSRGHWLRQIAFSPDGRTLTGLRHSSIAFWDANSGKLLGIKTQHPDTHCFAFSPDGRLVVTAGGYFTGYKEDFAVHLWKPLPKACGDL